MHIPSDDEISKFFENINPEDFATPTNDPKVTTEGYPRHGSEEFDRFTLDNLHYLVVSEEDTFAVLHNGDESRHYSPREGEELLQFINRMKKEAKRISAKWFFIGSPGEASMGAVFDPMDPKDVDNARRAGRMMEVTNWYSESVEPTSAEVRFGIIYDEEGEKRIVQSTYEQGANPAFKKVLRS